METWLRNNEHSIKALGILCAAAFTLLQYFAHLHENRVQQSLAFYKEFSSEPILSARDGLLQEVEQQQGYLDTFPRDMPPEPEADRLKGEWARYIVKRVNTNTELMVQLNNVLDFFDALQICIENNICDQKSAQDMLRIPAQELLGNFCPYIAYMRYDKNTHNEQFATQSDAFSGNACKAEKFKRYFESA